MANHYPALAAEPRAVPFNADARSYEAFSLGALTEAKGEIAATTLEQATAEATERWYWDRGDRLGIREQGQEDAPFWPFDKQSFDRLHVYAVQRSAPLRWKPVDYGARTEPVYRYSLKLLTTIDLGVFRGEGFQWSRQLDTSAAQGTSSVGDCRSGTVAGAPAGLSHSAVSQAKPLIDYREGGEQ